MAQKIRAALPPDIDLSGNWTIEWDAVDPVTGASVSGVVISQTSLRFEELRGSVGSGPFMLVPGPGA